MPTVDYTQLAYTQTAEAVDGGGVNYKIVVRFTPRDGDLPPGVTGVFVFRIVTETNPKADVFARVASLADLGKAAVSREAALIGAAPATATYSLVNATTTAEKLYLGDEITLTFNDLQVALQAKQILEQRVDQVLLDWKTYRDQFVGAAQTSFPLYTSSVVTAAKDRYVAAITARDTAAAALAAATAALADAQKDYTAADTELQRVDALRPKVCTPAAQLSTFSADLTSMYSATETFAAKAASMYAAVNTLVTALETTPLVSLRTEQTAALTALKARRDEFAVTQSGTSSFPNTLAAFALARTSRFDGPAADVVTACTTLQGQQASAQQAKNGAQNAKDRAQADATSAQAQSDTAVKDAAAALAAVLAVCPSFDPTTV